MSGGYGAGAGRAGAGATLRAVRALAGLGFRADPAAATLVAALIPLEFAGGVLQALALKGLTDAAGAGDGRGVLAAALLLVAVTAGWRVAGSVGATASLRLAERAGALLRRRLGELAAAVPTVEHLERPEFLKELDLVRQDGGGAMAALFQQLVVQLSTVGRLLLTVGLLAALSPWLALLPLFGLPSLLASAWGQRLMRRMNEEVVERRRLEWHFSTLAWTEPPAKEVRVFGLGDEVLRRHLAVRREVDRLEDGARLKATLAQSLGWLVFGAGFVGAVALIARQALAGAATPGDVVLLLALATQVNGQVAALSGAVTWALNSVTVAGRYVWLTDFVRAAAHPPADPAPAPERLTRGITLEGVGFRYPGAARPALDGVSLHLPAGQTVAVVGENGAGKSTLVKLLCRLYEPTAGRVLVDGVDTRRIPVADWRARLSGGFQDFARFMLVARRSVGVGRLAAADDDGAVRAALHQAGAADLVATLPRGLDQQLGRYFPDGTWLSDGQWQKLALGRAMMRPAPLLLVLDEPTASLDAPSEHALFERFAGAARRSAAGGGITVLVSHRFSTVRMADLIVVLDGGRVREAGSHAALVARGGLYAELYELQARAYR